MDFYSFRQYFVHHYPIHLHPVKAKIHEGPLRLFKNYLFRIRYQSDGCHARIGDYFRNTLQALE